MIDVGQLLQSDTVWAAAAVVVAAIGVIVDAVLAHVNNTSSRTLGYAMRAITVLKAPSELRDGLEVCYSGRRLNEPRLAEVALFNNHRRDILSSAFDQARALRFDLNAVIAGVIQVRCDPRSAIEPHVSFEDTILSVGPELIAARSLVVISVLVDGTSPSLTCLENPLQNVRLAKAVVSVRVPISFKPATWLGLSTPIFALIFGAPHGLLALSVTVSAICHAVLATERIWGWLSYRSHSLIELMEYGPKGRAPQ